MVDVKVFELAQHFLADFEPVDEAVTMELAQEIQDQIVDWINEAEREEMIKLKLDPDRLRDDKQEREQISRSERWED